MELKHIVDGLQALVEEGNTTFRRLRESAKMLGTRQLVMLETQARAKIVEGLKTLASKVAADEAKGEAPDGRAR